MTEKEQLIQDIKKFKKEYFKLSKRINKINPDTLWNYIQDYISLTLEQIKKSDLMKAIKEVEK